MSPPRIAVSGAKGRIGAALCRRLLDLTPRLERYSTQPGADGNFLATRALADPQALRGMDTLIHAAWSTVPVVAEQFPLRIWQVDLPLLAGILEAIRALPAAERPRLIFLSSASVYGRSTDGCAEDGSAPAPAGWYAFGKLSAERMIREFARRHDLEFLILRLSNVYGFWNASVPQGVIPRLLRASLTGEEVEIWGDGSAAKDYLHIDDALSAIAKIVATRATGLFNVSSGQSHRLAELIAYVEAATGRPVRRKHRPAFAWDASQPRIANRLFAGTFDWRPSVTIHEGIRRHHAELAAAL